jgi:hypothetical protein
MALSYLDAVNQGFPTVMAIANGDPMIYDNIDWTGGDAMPSQEDLDEWIAANPGWDMTKQLTKYQFRQLFTLEEKVKVDNFQLNPAIPQNYKNILVSILKDLELSEVVHLDNPQLAQGVGLLEQLGLIAPGRSTQIMANQPPV